MLALKYVTGSFVFLETDVRVIFCFYKGFDWQSVPVRLILYLRKSSKGTAAIAIRKGFDIAMGEEFKWRDMWTPLRNKHINNYHCGNFGSNLKKLFF